MPILGSAFVFIVLGLTIMRKAGSFGTPALWTTGERESILNSGVPVKAASCIIRPNDRLRELLRIVASTIKEPRDALAQGSWVKVICGASYQDLPRIRFLALVYTLAGVDCIDMSADEAVLTAVEQGVESATQLASELGHVMRRPWLMISLNDQEDLHFRKASFNASKCPATCPRPCERLCPTSAIAVTIPIETFSSEGVAHQNRCYGCGRCIAVCPLGLIEAKPYRVDAPRILQSLAGRLNAMEIHTNLTSLVGPTDAFRRLWDSIRAHTEQLDAVSVSFPYLGELGTEEFLQSRMHILQQWTEGAGHRAIIWQVDGRPMSGDIGRGSSASVVRYAEEALRSTATQLGTDPHFLQLAGGTNLYTASKLQERGLLNVSGQRKDRMVSGLAFGGCARKQIDQVLQRFGEGPESLVPALEAAVEVVQPIKARAAIRHNCRSRRLAGPMVS